MGLNKEIFSQGQSFTNNYRHCHRYQCWLNTGEDRSTSFMIKMNSINMMNHRSLLEYYITETLIIRQAIDTIKENPELAPVVTKRHPDLMSIIEDLNLEQSEVDLA